MARQIIRTNKAPAAIGTYSQAVKVDQTVYLSGQIPLVPEGMELVEGDIAQQIRRVFDNLQAVCQAAGGELGGIVKLNVFLTDLGNSLPSLRTVLLKFHFTHHYSRKMT